MKGLLQRLSALDADAENAVRLISFFDALIESGRATLDDLVGNSARLAGCPLGIAVPAQGIHLRADAHGDPLPIVTKARPDLSRATPAGGYVWLERTSGWLPLDAILLERLALACAILIDRRHAANPELDQAGSLQTVLTGAAPGVEISRALHRLGIAPYREVRAIAVRGTWAPAGALHAVIGSLGAIIDVSGSVAGNATPATVAAGIGPCVRASEVARSWRAACVAVRFARPGPFNVVRWESLGGLAVLADKITKADIVDVADVAALDELASGAGAEDTLDVLMAYASSESLRQAAALVHRHHSSVAARIAKAEGVLGFPLHTALGRLRLSVALVLYRLRPDAPPL